ncbi:MAG: prolipoprotein diacylglyceryl transferase, partial [Pirellulales bacterium]|nr:prolipoprotein diacylglyceryl transferase [Pirellulales bacterium]
MQRTLLSIPHEIAGFPVLGFGWLLVILCIALAIRLIWAWRTGQSLANVLAVEGLMWAMVAAAIVFVLPIVELKNVDGQPVGMAIRGYGVMLLLGVASGVALACYRAKRVGIDPELILSMAPWAFLGGIVGARLFYVIQYRHKFMGETFGQTLRNMLVFTEGGLVVYGSFIGGFIALVYFIYRNKLPLLKLGDVIVPCLFIGVFFGRVGCLMNGCCYGGRCQEGWSAMYFPAGSAVYHDQLASGELLGLEVEPATGEIRQVREGSLASEAGIEPGEVVEKIADDFTALESA